MITKQPISYKSLKDKEVELSVEVEPVSEGQLSYQWYISEDNATFTKIENATKSTLTVKESEESKKYYYAKITHSFESESNTRAVNPAYKKKTSIRTETSSVEFYEPIKFVNPIRIKNVDLYSEDNINLEINSHVYSDKPINIEWYKKGITETDSDTLVSKETINLFEFSEINCSSTYTVPISIFTKHCIESYYYYVIVSCELEGNTFSQSNIIEVKSGPNTGLKMLSIDTVDSKEPTCRYLKNEGITQAYVAVDKEKVSGRIVLSQNDEILYDSGEYEKSNSGMTIKIRGNGSAYKNKKGFKIKLQKKEDLLFRGDKKFKNKNWVLLADASSLNTVFGFMIAEIVDFAWTPKYEIVDLVINGQYRGPYILVESIEEDETRINVSDSGFIIERDNYGPVEAQYETIDTPPVYFTTNLNKTFSFKFPDEDDITEEQIESITSCLNNFEESLSDGKYEDYIDLNSWASWYIVQDVIGQSDTSGTNKYVSKFDSNSTTLLKMETPWDFEYLFADGLKMQNDTQFYSSMLFNNTNKAFVNAYKDKWSSISQDLITQVSNHLSTFNSKYSTGLNKARNLEANRWKNTIPKTVEEEMDKINNWIAKQIPIITSKCEQF